MPELHVVSVEQSSIPPASAKLSQGVSRLRLSVLFGSALSLAVLLVVGSVVRFIGITRQSLWLDEAFSVYLAAHPFAQIIQFTAGSDAHPPLYYIFLHVWMVLGSSPFMLRLLSAVASIGALPVTYLLTRKLLHRDRVALLATALMAFSAFQIWYAQEIRMYALTTLFILLALYWLVSFIEHRRFASWAGFTFAILIACYLDYSALYVCISLAIWFGLYGWRHIELRKPFIVSATVVFMCYLPWLPSLVRQIFYNGGAPEWIASSNSSGVSNVFTSLLFNWSNLSLPDTGLSAVTFSILSLIVVALALWLPRREPSYPFLAIWVSIPIAIGVAAEIIGHPILIPRNVAVLEPGLFILLAAAVSHSWENFRREGRALPQAAVLAFCLIVLFAMNVQAQALASTTTIKEDWSHAASVIERNQRPGDLLLFESYYAEMPFNYYFARITPTASDVRECGYQAQEFLLYVNPADAAPCFQSDRALAGYERVWLIASHAASAVPPPWIASHYQLERHWDMVGISILLYQELAT